MNDICSLREAKQHYMYRNGSIGILTVFNGNSRSTSKMIHLPVHSTVSVHDENLETIDFEVCLLKFFSFFYITTLNQVIKMSKSFYTPETLHNSPYQLSFNAELPALSFKTYIVRRSRSAKNLK